jgi:hypothetical protein
MFTSPDNPALLKKIVDVIPQCHQADKRPVRFHETSLLLKRSDHPAV